MTLYDAVLLLRARWRWLLGLPMLAAVSYLVVLMVLPLGYEARVLIRLDAAVPMSDLVDLQGITATPRKGDARLIEVAARSSSAEYALLSLWAALSDVTRADTVRRHEQVARRERLIAERAALRGRRDRFAVIEYEALTRAIEALRDVDPSRATFTVVEPARIELTAWFAGLMAAGLAGFGAAGAGVCVAAWWRAERMAHHLPICVGSSALEVPAKMQRRVGGL